MAEISKKYEEILNELSKKISNKEELNFVKEKLSELTFCYIDSINKLLDIENKQSVIEKKVRKLQRDIDNIEEDIYIEQEDDNDELDIFDEDCCFNDGYDFEIICPYCDYEFVADSSSQGEKEMLCPRCHKAIELDWNDEECSGECNGCHHSCCQEEYDDEMSEVSEESEPYKPQNNNNIKQNNQQNNNDDDM